MSCTLMSNTEIVLHDILPNYLLFSSNSPIYIYF
jgi:hypothetical protein